MKSLAIDQFQIHIPANDWKEAIINTSNILLARKAISNTYIEAMINVVETNGPVIVICPNVALAHARPECGVHKFGISFSLLEKPVFFGVDHFDPVKLVITLAALDAGSHIEIMSELADILLDDDKMNQIFQVETREQIYAIFTE